MINIVHNLVNLINHRYGHFSGINRKVQLKAINDKRNHDLKMKFKGRNKKSQTSIANSKALLLILKWGGELTPMGKTQAEDLGRAFRCLYPGGQGISVKYSHTNISLSYDVAQCGGNNPFFE